MVDLLGYAAFGAERPAPTRPPLAPLNAPSDPDTFGIDCTTVTSDDGTSFQAAHFNAVLEQLRKIIRQNGVVEDNTDDFMLARAQRSQRVNFLNAGGTANAITLTSGFAFGSVSDLAAAPLRFVVVTTNTASVNLSVDGLAAKPVLRPNGAVASGGDLLAGVIAEVIYVSALDAFLLLTTPGGLFQAIPGFVRTYNASSVWTKPAGLSYIRVRGRGGHGGGGGSVSAPDTGQAGGTGAFFEAYLAATDLAATETVTIGASGAGVPANSASFGSPGGSTTFKTWTAGGGGGGQNNAGVALNGGVFTPGSVGRGLGSDGWPGGGSFYRGAATPHFFGGGSGNGGTTGGPSSAGTVGRIVIEEFY